MTEDRGDVTLRRRVGELQRLVELRDTQIQALHAKIRGYETLGSVCQEKINECQRLESQVMALEAQVVALHMNPMDSSLHRINTASGSDVATRADTQCQTGDTDTSLASAGIQSLRLISLTETHRQPAVAVPTSQAMLLEASRDEVDPRGEVDPRSVVETVALVCSAVKDSVNGSSDDTPLSSQLDQLTIAVRKLEKQYLTQQTVVDGLIMENNRLKQQLESTSSQKDQQILSLREEISRLRGTSLGTTEGISIQDMHEWVKVTQSPSEAEVVKMSSPLSVEPAYGRPGALYQKKIQELQAELESFKVANDQWKEHSQCIELEHQDVKAVWKQKLTESQHLVQRYRSEGEQRQNDVDNLLIAAKEKLVSEQQQRQDVEQKLSSLACRTTQLQTQTEHMTRDAVDVNTMVTQLRQQVTDQQQMIRELTDDRHNSLQSLVDVQTRASSDLTTPETLRTQVALLQHQVAVYKDDFNSERADRVRTQEAKDDIQSQLTQVTADAATYQSQILLLREDLTTADRNKHEQEEVTRRLRQRIRELEARHPFQYVNVIQSEHTHVIPTATGSQWTCVRCTYSNIGARSTCEICGTALSGLPLVVENMPIEPMRFVARNLEQCDSAGDSKLDIETDSKVVVESDSKVDTESDSKGDSPTRTPTTQ